MQFRCTTAYVEVKDKAGNKRKFLANEALELQLLKVSRYVQKMRKNGERYHLDTLKRFLGFLLRVKGLPLSKLTLDCLIPFVQLKFSEQDFEEDEDFKTNKKGQFLNPDKVEQKLAMSEAVARRRATQAAEGTWKILEEFFEWRDQALAKQG